MMSFGIGAAVPLAAIDRLSSRLRVPLTGGLRRFWTAGKPLLGTMLVAVGVLVVSGLGPLARSQPDGRRAGLADRPDDAILIAPRLKTGG